MSSTGKAGSTGGRVVDSHRIASAAFRLAAVYAIVAVGWAVLVLIRGGSWWGPLHAFLAGSVLLAISGATQLFTITWAAAPAPSATTAGGQRWALAVGVGLVLVGMATDNVWAVASGAVIAVGALVILASSLVASVRRSLLRRFDLSSRFYLLALASGAVGVTLGGLLGTGTVGSSYPEIRLVHSHLNLVGLVGFTIVGTLPTILPTFAHHKVVSGAEARYGWWLAVASVAAIIAGLMVGNVAVGTGTVIAAAALLVVLAGVVGRLGKRGLQGGLAYYQVVLGCGWLAAWAFVDGIRLLSGVVPGPFSGWTGAVVAAGVGQVLLGSMSYLVPVLAGKPPRLGRNLDRAMRRDWVPLVSANLAGIAFVGGFGPLAVALTGLWALDFAYRLVTFEWSDEPCRSCAGRPATGLVIEAEPVAAESRAQADWSTAKGHGTPTSGPENANSS